MSGNLRLGIRTFLIAVLLLLMAAASIAIGVWGSSAAATDIGVDYPDNRTCASFGYDFELKIEPVVSGPYTDGTLSVTIDVYDTSSGQVFDFTSNIGVDAVFAKGGSGGRLYTYNEAMSGTALHAPVNPNNGKYYDLSHISFCYDLEVVVDKTAQTSFTRTYQWSIDKSVNPGTWDLFTGDSGTSKYTVAVTRTGYVDSNWAVNGSISITNPAPVAAMITGVTDSVSGGINAPVNCGVAFPYSLAAGQTLNCTYATALPDGTNRINTAVVTTSGVVGGGSDTADVLFGDPTTVVNGSINVDDTNGSSWQFSDSGSVEYTRTFDCDADEGVHNNTATIRETGQNDSASVTVNCYALVVTKNATTTFTQTWDWTIDKSADESNLLLSQGQLFQVNYTVMVDATSSNGSFAVSGDIWVQNPNLTRAAQLTSVNDVVSPAIAASVDCPTLTVPAGGTLHCTYSTALPDASTRLNTATATLQNYAYDSDGIGTANGTSFFTGTANVVFDLSSPAVVVDECIDVSDTNVGILGTVCASDAPKTFTYSLWFGMHPDADVVLVCGENIHRNIASFVTNDTGTTGRDTWTVNATVSCLQGCTLTQGYWKTHSQFGPAPFDDAWFNLGDVDGDGVSEGANETFFLSGQTYYQVLWTAPKGNAYYNLAHQYIAAKLNVLNGASSTAEVDAALAYAENFFATKTPSASMTKAQRNTVLNNASVLDRYNNGLIGPGHCSE
jgi:hypothetical protein